MPFAHWTREISAAEFYESLETVCPKCGKCSPTETPQNVALASVFYSINVPPATR